MKKIVQLVILFFGIVYTHAQTQGTLDSSFLPGNNGRKGANQGINAVIKQPDGKLILGGWFENYNGINKNRLVRINPDGSMDESFNQIGISSSGNAGVESLAIQPDGKILVGGKIKINNSNGNAILEHLMRLNPDGSLDSSFAIGIPISSSPFYFTCGNGEIFSISVQNNGKIIVAGDITFCVGSTINDNENIIRLNTDGTIDTSFMSMITETGLPGFARIHKTIIQPDGKILVIGYFNESNGFPSPYITRLNSDGSTDTTFVVGSGFDDDVKDMILQPDGKIVAVGDFLNYNGTGVNKIIRLNSDGSIDTTFTVPVGAQNQFSNGSASLADLKSVSIQPDGKLIVSGGFNLFDGVQISQVARLNADGSLDTTYNNSVSNPSYPSVLNTNVLSDGGVLLTGTFSNYQFYKRDNILKIDSNGDLDFTFNQHFGPSNTLNNSLRINDIQAHSSGYYVGGQFTEYNDQFSKNIAKINEDGSLDTNFSTGIGPDNGFEDEVVCMAVQIDDKVLVGGDFDDYNGTQTNKIARLNLDGSLDTSFNIGSGFNGIVESIFVQPDGKILVGGNFLNYNGTPVDHLARLNPDGTLDTSFNPSVGDRVYAVSMDQNGKIYVGLFYSDFAGTNTNAVVRLNADGSLDPSFNFTVVGIFSNARVNAFAFDSSGNIYITGRFIELGTGKNFSTYKLLSNGNPYTAFNSPETPNEGFDIALQSDGKIIVGGDIEEVEFTDGTLRDIRGVIRLNTDGTFDDTFNPDNANEAEGIDIETNFIGEVNALHLDNDGRLIVGGKFASYNGEQKLPLVAVNAFNDVPDIVLIPDPNFEQALIDEGIDLDGAINGQILESEALATIALDVSSKNISDLTGIDAFINLQTINVSNNSLTQLSLIDNLNLTAVNASNNLLQSFDIKNFNNTNITSFNSLNNPNLTCIQVDDIAFSNTNWTDIDPQSFFSDDCSQAVFFNIPDPNFEQVLIDDGIDSDGVINGQMLETDALGVVDLDVSSQNISDLTGIEFFTDLETLSAFNNNLSTINLSQNNLLISALLALNNLSSVDFSNNPNLVSVSLNDNNLTSIDISNNLNLTQLFINNNSLTSIDVSSLTNLENLGVFGNNLSTLDISQNTNLFTLFCNNNQLQSLNVQNGNNTNFDNFEAQNNPGLTCISVDDVAYSNTNWQNASPQFNFDAQMFFSLNCSTLISIPDPNFEQALIDESVDTDGIVNGTISEADALNATSLNVSSKNISDLTGIEFFTNLNTLFALDNNLTYVDLDGNTSLTSLTLSLNNLTQINLQNNVNLTSLALASNQLSSLDLSNNQLLSQVYISGNELNSLDVSALIQLTELEASFNQLVELDLSQNPVLSQVYVNNNNLVNLNVKNSNNTAITTNFFNASNNTSLFCIEVDDPNYSTSTWTNLDAQSFFGSDCAPINDNCSSAQPITLGQSATGSTQSSTSSANTPDCQESGIIIVDVWFQFVAPPMGSVTLTLNAGTLTLKSALYENCTDLNPIACGVDGIQVDNLTPGQTYFVQTWVEATGSDLLSDNITEVGDFTIKVDDTSTLSSLSVENKLDFIFYPNPAKDFISITSNKPIDSYQIYTINGKAVIDDKAINSAKREINVSELSSGVYLLKVIFRRHKLYSKANH